MRKILIFCFLLLSPIVAQKQYNLSFEHFHVSDGLPSGEVLTFYQDSKGFIWLGTTNGLSKFDGYNFTNYRLSSSENAPAATILAILEDTLDNKRVT